MGHLKTINYAHNLLSIRHAIWDSHSRKSSKSFFLNSALLESQFWTSVKRFMILLSGKLNSEVVRIVFSAFCSLEESRLAEPVRTVSSGLCSLRRLILKQFELICLNSALWESQGWTSSNRFVWALLSETFNSEAVRTDLSEFCSLGQSRLNQFEPFRQGSAL
jgi:hypothetical protein